MSGSAYIIIIVSFFSCTAYAQLYPAGIIIDTVSCSNDFSNTYTLYLPESYTAENKYPVVFIHDPAARGRLATSVFAHAANTYHYILCCSNLTNNNMPPQDAMNLSGMMQKDVIKKFSVDTSRQYTCGFSGGSRLASAIAMQQKNIEGIIACGAGLAGGYYTADHFDNKIAYAAVAGTYDMNYVEMYSLEKKLNTASVTARLFEFNGGHEWCDSATAMHVFAWLELLAMKDKKTAMRNDFIDSLFTGNLLSVKKDIEAKNYYGTCRELDYIERDKAGLPYSSEKLDSLRKKFNPDLCSKEMDKIEKIFFREEQLRTEYNTYIQYRLPGTYIADSAKLKNDNWWKLTGNKLQKQARDSASAEGQSAARLYDMLWRNCWEQGEVYYNAEKFTAARELFYLYTLLSEDSKYAWFFLAESESMLGHETIALKNLEKAIDKGFRNTELLENEKAFSSMHDNKKFNSLLEMIKKAEPE